jgi:hypothetical protein
MMTIENMRLKSIYSDKDDQAIPAEPQYTYVAYSPNLYTTFSQRFLGNGWG